MHRIMNIDPKPSMNGVRLEEQGEWESSSIVTSSKRFTSPSAKSIILQKPLNSALLMKVIRDCNRSAVLTTAFSPDGGTEQEQDVQNSSPTWTLKPNQVVRDSTMRNGFLTYRGIISTSLSTFSDQHQFTTRVEKSQIVLIITRVSTCKKFHLLIAHLYNPSSRQGFQSQAFGNWSWPSSSCIVI
jgi:hypothetical protein